MILSMHSLAPRLVAFPELGSRSSDSGVFMCVVLERGINMDTKKKLFCI